MHLFVYIHVYMHMFMTWDTQLTFAHLERQGKHLKSPSLNFLHPLPSTTGAHVRASCPPLSGSTATQHKLAPGLVALTCPTPEAEVFPNDQRVVVAQCIGGQWTEVDDVCTAGAWFSHLSESYCYDFVSLISFYSNKRASTISKSISASGNWLVFLNYNFYGTLQIYSLVWHMH